MKVIPEADQIEVVEAKLADALRVSAQQRKSIAGERKARVAAEAERDALREALADKRRLAREIDVALHGEDGAAPQANLCDLVGSIKELREERDRLRDAAKRARDYIKGPMYDRSGPIIRQIDAALNGGKP